LVYQHALRYFRASAEISISIEDLLFACAESQIKRRNNRYRTPY